MATPSIEVAATRLTRREISESVAVNSTTRTRLVDADLIILPYQVGQDVFTARVGHMLAYFTGEAPALRVEIATDSESPAELVLHGELFDLGKFLVQWAAWPIVLNLISNYVWAQLTRGSAARLRCELVVERQGESVSIKYDGPASNFQSAVDAALKSRQRNRRTP